MSIWYCLKDASRARINPSIDARVRDTPSLSVWLTTDATCGNSSTGYSDAPMQKKVTRSGRYINAAEAIRVINVVDFPRCAVATTMMLSISASIACTRWACSSGMSTIPTGNTRPGFCP